MGPDVIRPIANDGVTHMARSIPEKIRANVAAITSPLVAVFSLTCNTWRNELTEEKRKVRHAGFEVLRKPGELQQVYFPATTRWAGSAAVRAPAGTMCLSATI
jgi:hypothetical protein